MEIGQHFNYLIQLRFRGQLWMCHIYLLEADWRHRHPACAGCNGGKEQTLHFNGDGSCNRRARLCRGVLSDSPRTKTRVAAFTEATRLVALHSHAPWWSFERGCRSREPLGSMEYDVRRARSTYQERRPLTNGTERFESV